MKSSYLGLALGALVVAGAALSLPSCGHDQKLTGITVTPSSFTFLTEGGSEQFTATANYIHPPSSKDVTSQAVWSVDDGVVSVNAGLVTADPTFGCGGGTVSATLPAGTGGSSNIVTGYATVTVDNPADPICPGGGTEATLSVQISGNGTVSSLTGGISCPGHCVEPFPVGASVGLTAVPGPGTTVTWSSACSSTSGNNCTVTIPSGGANVLATFQP